MKIGLAILVLGFCMNAWASEQQTAVDSLFVDYQGGTMPGAAVMVLKNDEVALMRTYGMANIEESEPVRPATNFRLASISKQFTATCIMLLVERGQLNLDDTLTELFEGFPEYGSDINLRDLLGHTSGLIDYESLMPEDYQGQVSDQDALEYMQQVDHTYFVPGTEYRYSNTAYAMMAVLVEQVSGMSFASFLQQNIFEPLGMEQTVAYQKGISTVSNRAYGYTVEQGKVTPSDQSSTSR